MAAMLRTNLLVAAVLPALLSVSLVESASFGVQAVNLPPTDLIRGPSRNLLRSSEANMPYISWPSVTCREQSGEELWRSDVATCRAACSGNVMCGAWSFNFKESICKMKPYCIEMVWDEDYYTEVKKSGGKSEKLHSRGGTIGLPESHGRPSQLKRPAVCTQANEPFGLENCACDGASGSREIVRQACAYVKVQCGAFVAFSTASQDELLAQVQRICDSFAMNACIAEAPRVASQDPQCAALLQRGTTQCTADEAVEMFDSQVIDGCMPLCKNCMRL